MISEALLFQTTENSLNLESEKSENIVKNLQTNLDLVIHEPKRLSILLLLTQNQLITFSTLQKLLETTSGNLTNHLKHLTKEYLVKTSKTFVNTRPCTVISITKNGLERLKEYQSTIETLFSSFSL